MDMVETDSSYFKAIADQINLEGYTSDAYCQAISQNNIILNAGNMEEIEQIRQKISQQGFVTLTISTGLFSSPEEFAKWQTNLCGPIFRTNEGDYYKVMVVSGSPLYIKSNNSQPTHTDEGYGDVIPRIISLYCKTAAAQGGVSILVLLEPLLEALKIKFANKFNLLFDPQAITVHNIKGFESKPVLFKLQNGLIGISYTAILESVKCSREVFEMFDFITKYAHNPYHQIRFKLKENELLIIDNYRILHGRTRFLPEDKRELHRFWFAGWE